MKRLLILTLILALTSSASADLDGWSLRIAGPSQVLNDVPEQGDYYEPEDPEVFLVPGEYLWIGVYNSIQGGPADPRRRWLYLVFVDSPVGEWTGNWIQYKPPLVPDAQDNVYFGVVEGGDSGLPYDIDGWCLYLEDGIPGHYNGVGVLDAKEFRAVAGAVGGEVLLLDDTLETVLDSFVIFNVPEPATILLLGLGGLTIFRKRRT